MNDCYNSDAIIEKLMADISSIVGETSTFTVRSWQEPADWKPGDSIDIWHIVGSNTRREDNVLQAITEDRERIAKWCERNADDPNALRKLVALLRGQTL